GQALRPKPLADHPLIASQAGQPDLEAVAGVRLKEVEVLQNPAVAGERADVDIERRVATLGAGARRGGLVGAKEPLRLMPDFFSWNAARRDGDAARGIRQALLQGVEHALIGRFVAVHSRLGASDGVGARELRLRGVGRRRGRHRGRRGRRSRHGGDGRGPAPAPSHQRGNRHPPEGPARSPHRHLVEKWLPRIRFVAFSTASAAPRGGSVSVRYVPTSRVAFDSSRAERDTITTVASNARTAFTPSSSNSISACTASSRAFTAASAEHRSSPAGEVTPSACPENRVAPARPNWTLARQRPFGSRWNVNSCNRKRSVVPGGAPPLGP